MTYAFLLDVSACSGCKACQAACKDKNQLPLGVLWRRIYEVSGGGWKQEGAAWSNTLFAYNLSLSCNHCVHPKCAGVCPVDAFTVRPEGIVLLDSSKCVGCGYCGWACPYGAPQYDRTAGTMTKCDFCIDNLELGLPPACIAACPMRVLDFAEVNDGQSLTSDRVALWEVPAAEHPYPMPGNSLTQPRLAIKPHAAMKSQEEKSVANHEEVHPRKGSGWEETPLVVFTLLMQMAVGALWAMLWLVPDIHRQFLPVLLIGLCLNAGLAASLAHLGTKRNAWRVLSHLRKSWLSREILFAIVFDAAWLATLTSLLLRTNLSIFNWLTALIGLGLIQCMSQIYRLPAVAAWDSWRTNTRFFLSAALLGILGMAALLTSIQIPALPRAQIGFIVVVLLLTQAALGSQSRSIRGKRLQHGLILAGMIGSAILVFMPAGLAISTSIVVFFIILIEEGAGRWFFYQART